MWKALLKLLLPAYADKHVQTVRYAFPVVTMTAVIAGLAAVIAGDSSYITIESSPETVTEDSTFYITVKATAHTPVNAIDITIDYPESQMRVESIDTGTSVITLWAEKPYAKDGHVYLRGGTFQRGFVGQHTIARIRATALASGLAHVGTESATFIAGDGKGTEVKVSDTDESKAHLTIVSENGSLIGTASLSIITDVDGDGQVDIKDISSFMAAWFTRKNTFDFNGDGKMTFRDFSILLADSFFK